MQAKIVDAYPLSHLQEGLLFQAEYAKDSDAYFVQNILHLKNIKPDVLKEALNFVVDAHDILKAGVLWEGISNPVLYIPDQVTVPFEMYDWEKVNGDLETFIKTDRTCGFDLTHAPLMRVSLLQKNESEYVMVWSCHHIILDGWSSAIVFNEVFQAYSQLLHGKQVELKTRKPYREYIGWLKRQDKTKVEEFWKKYLHGIPNATQLSFSGLIKTDEVDYRVNEYGFSKEKTAKLQEFCRAHNITANTLLVGALGAVLKRYLNQDEIVIGMTTSGRNIGLSGIEEMIGLFINTLPVRMKFNGQPVAEYLSSLQKDIQEVNEFGNVSLAKLQSLSGYGKDLFNVQFVYENYPIDDSSFDGIEISESSGIEKTEYPLSIAACLANDKLTMRYSYQTEHFDQNIIDKLVVHLEKFLEKTVENPNVAVDRIDILTEEEKKQQLVEWNNTAAEYPRDKCIHGLFEEQVEKSPEAIAVVFEDKHLTYGELNARANQLARYLREQGIRADDLVGICIERSLEMIIGILGILKAGGAYVPLDPSYPKDRLDYMESDSGAKIVIDEKYLQNKAIWKEPKGDLTKVTSSKNLAYVIYTSGSTGKPKGVQIANKNVLSLLDATKEYFDFASSDIWSCFHSYAFDFSVWEIFGSLLSGAKMLLISYAESRNVMNFCKIVKQQAVSFLSQTPSAFYQFADNSNDMLYPSLKYVIFGGEALDFERLKNSIKNNFSSTNFVNMYGITEITVHATYLQINREGKESRSLVGKNLKNLQLYVLDQDQQLIPSGVAGEICIGGVGLARGYLNQPALTAEKFIANPFGNGDRLYRTGDLGRYLPDGNIEFLGRIDNQVKIRGFRIELGEIEAAINDCDQVKASVALAKDGQLVAYIVPNNINELEESYKFKTQQDEEIIVFAGEKAAELVESVRAKISHKLPEYMIPSYFVVLEKIPLTPNGKTDGKLLQTLDTGKRLITDEYVAPRNELERKLCEIWQEVLHLDKVGINDNFFKIGGDSIKIIRCVAKINDALKVGICISDIFDNLTIQKLVTNINNRKTNISSEKYEKFSLVDKSIFNLEG